MTRRAKVAAGLAVAAMVGVPLGMSQGGGSIDVFVGSTPTPTSTPGFTCTTTISSGSVSTALSSLTAGGTLCLNAGTGSTYSYTASTINKASMTTVRAANGLTRDQVAIPAINLQASNNLTFQTLTIAGGNMGGSSTSSTNVTLTDINFTGDLCIQLGNNNTSRGILVSYSSFINVGRACGEGRLEIDGFRDKGGVTHTQSYDQGVVIDHNLFQGPGPDASNCADGIQGADGAVGVTITNNIFRWIDQHPIDHGTGSFDCSDVLGHIDPLQPFDSDYLRIEGNFFDDNTTGLLNADCAAKHTIVKNNVFNPNGEYGDQLQVAGGLSGSEVENNVVMGTFRTLGNSCNGYAGTLLNNVFTDGLTGNAPTGTTDYNISPSASVRGVHGLNASPIFVGPVTSPGGVGAAWANFALDSSSPGYHAGSTGSSMGINP